MSNFRHCLKKKQKIDKHISIIEKIEGVKEVIDNTKDEERYDAKNDDLTVITDKDSYQTECKTDSSRNDGTILVELIANFRKEKGWNDGSIFDVSKFYRQFFTKDDPVREEFEEMVHKLGCVQDYKSTALYKFEDSKQYLYSYYVHIQDDDKAHYLLDLKALSKWVKKNWREQTLILNTDDSCSVMVKLQPEDFQEFLISEKKDIRHKRI